MLWIRCFIIRYVVCACVLAVCRKAHTDGNVCVSVRTKSSILCIVYYLWILIKKYWIQIWTVWISNISIGCTLTVCHVDVAVVVIFFLGPQNTQFVCVCFDTDWFFNNNENYVYVCLCVWSSSSIVLDKWCLYFPALWLNSFESGSLIYLHKCHLFVSETVFI